MDKAKLIDAGVDVLSGWELFMDNGCGEIRDVYSDEYATIVDQLLKALCKELPEVNQEKGLNDIEHQQICARIEKGLQQNQSLAHIATNIQKTKSMVYYNQLKQWGNDE